MTLTYELKFFDYWHLGSGLSAGAKLDSTVTKDDKDIPYASGKTIKGLAREMAELLYADEEFIKRCFGNEGIDNGKCYFKNALLDEFTRDDIISNKLQDRLYDTMAFTQVKDGIAIDDSLREIEVTIPVALYGEILDIGDKDDYEKLKASLKMIKRMGLNRNRGLGRCEFIVGAAK